MIPDGSPVRLDATARLLVLLARHALDAEARARVLALVDKVEDWPEFVALAQRNFALPLAYHHFSQLGLGATRPDVMAMIRPAAIGLTLQNLGWQFALRRFYRTCLEPIAARHVFFKGPVLGARYYPDAGLRICRDIDVLVAEADFDAVARRALAAGYRFILGIAPLTYADDPQDIDFVIRRADVIAVHDPDGFLFDIHRRIEKLTPLFSAQQILDVAEPVQIGPASVGTMAIDWLFCYLAYHHSRHFWSKLHWVADIHAVSADPAFDRARVLDLARRLGIARTVEATLAFAALTSRPEDWAEALHEKAPGAAFLEGCLRGLPGDSAFEFSQWKGMFLFDFEADWQIDYGRKYRFWALSALRRLEPNLTQYLANRRPRALEFLYTLDNMRALGGNALMRLRGRGEAA
jgi:Uncharacterised nucleotidyltransferase